MDRKHEQLITLCCRCAERMSETYYLTETPGSEGREKCQMPGPHYGITHQYEYTSKATVAMRRALAARNAKIDMGGKDTRARHKEPWRDF